MAVCGVVGGVLSLISRDIDITWSLSVAVALVGFEVLFYQARYAINDLVGVHRDALHPNAGGRSRIPLVGDGTRDRVRLRIVAASVAIRIGLWSLVVWSLPGPYRGQLVVVTIVLIGISVVYDASRALAQRGAEVSRRRGQIGALMTILTIGGGYAVRGSLAFYLVSQSKVGLFSILAFLYLVGSASVWSTWAIGSFEFIPLLSRLKRGPSSLVDGRISTDPHKVLLAQHAEFLNRENLRFVRFKASELLGDFGRPVLQERTSPDRLWDLAAVAASLCAIAFGAEQAAAAGAPTSAGGLILVGVALLLSAVAAVQRHPLAMPVALTFCALAVGLALVTGFAWREALVLVYPPTLVALMVPLYFGLSPRMVRADTRVFTDALVKIMRVPGRAFAAVLREAKS